MTEKNNAAGNVIPSVSEAARKNWRRLGRVGCLTSRANKTESRRVTVAVECCPDKKYAAALRSYANSLALKYGGELSRAAHVAAVSLCINLLSRRNIPAAGAFTARLYSMERDAELEAAVLPEPCFPDGLDFAAALYSSLHTDGEKSRRGLYYTPRPVAMKLCANFHGGEFFDPCCGGGMFLSCADTSPRSLHGCDVDPYAVLLSTAAMYLRFPGTDFVPDVRCSDFLGDDSFDAMRFDFIATNPPWGALLPSELMLGVPAELRQVALLPDGDVKSGGSAALPDGDVKNKITRQSVITSGESFSRFFVKSARLLESDGAMSFLLPRSVLNVAAHSDLRRFIADSMELRSVELFGQSFSGVQSKPVALTVSAVKSGAPVRIVTSDETVEVSQSRINEADGYAIPTFDDADAALIAKLYTVEHTKLSGRFAMGIVTGNNAALVKTSQEDGFEAVITGSDISPYRIKRPSRYVMFEREKFQQCASGEVYRERKLVYRFIADRPVFAADLYGTLTLNSANIFIPDGDFYFTLALLNSSAYAFLWRRLSGGVKVLRSKLERLPVPFADDETVKRLSELAQSACHADETDAVMREIDAAVMDLFMLDDGERGIIERDK